MNLLKRISMFVFMLALAPAISFADDAIERVVASSYGFDAQDATDALQKAIDSGAKVVYVDKQETPWIVRPLNLRSGLELVLEEGAEIVAKQGEFKSLGECLMKAVDASDLTIRGEGKGACLRMRKKEYWKEPYKLSEWRHGVSLLSCSNVSIENLTIAETGGDGIYVGVYHNNIPCKNISIKKVDCVENNRQGISVISVDGLLIEDCVLRDTVGTPPAAGIDLEPNLPGEQITNVVLRRVLAIDNEGCGFAFYLPNMEKRGQELSFVLEDCKAIRNRSAGVFLHLGNGETKSLPGKMEFVDCEISGNPSGVKILGKPSSGASLLFKDVEIKTPSAVKTLGAGDFADYDYIVAKDADVESWVPDRSTGIQLQCNGTDSEPNGGIAFENVKIVDACSEEVSPLFWASDITGSVGFQNIDGALDIERIDGSGSSSTSKIVVNDKEFLQRFPELKPSRVGAVDLSVLNKDPKYKELANAWRERIKKTGETKQGMRLRYNGSFYFYAEKDETLEATFRQLPVGNYAFKPATLTVETPSGEKETLGTIEKVGNEQNVVSYKVKETGWNRIDAKLGSGSLELTSANLPVLTSAFPRVTLISSPGAFEFYVPKGTPDLGVRVIADTSAERVTATLYDPDGEQVARFENIETSAAWEPLLDEQTGEPIAPKAGFWTLKFERPTIGVLEDFYARVLGVPALLR